MAHKTAVNSFNANHTLYDQLRPTYQEPIVDSFLKDLNLHSGSKILELAAGTGKFTRKLVERGYKDIEVVEPSKGMLESFSKSFPEISVHLGSSYEIPLPDKSVDSIIVAQGFHWFSDEKSIKEMRRVLKDSGKVGLIWNFDGESDAQNVGEGTEVKIFGDVDSQSSKAREVAEKVFLTHPWNKKVVDYVYSFDTKVPQYRHGKWRDILTTNTEFKPISKEAFFFYRLPVRYNDVYKYWETRSYITELDAEGREEVEDKVNKILEENVTESDKQEIDGDVVLEKFMGTHTVVFEPK